MFNNLLLASSQGATGYLQKLCRTSAWPQHSLCEHDGFACNCRGYSLTNFWGDAQLKKAAGEDELAYLDLYQVHYYDDRMGTGNPKDVFHHPAADLVSSGKPILLGEIAVSISLCMLFTKSMLWECLWFADETCWPAHLH